MLLYVGLWLILYLIYFCCIFNDKMKEMIFSNKMIIFSFGYNWIYMFMVDDIER